jgi:copper homeostasis protein
VLRVALEIAVGDLDGLRAAHAGGADRVEVSAALSETGGVTPSAGTVEALVDSGLLPVHVLVRPRPGDFVYSAEELDVMVRDIRVFTSIGVAGCVIGALTPGGWPDEPALERLAGAAEGLEITWHRMVDTLDRPDEIVARAADLGVDRILTSGAAHTAIEGVAALERMVGAAAERVQIMAGGGVRAEHVGRLMAAGVSGIHLSASKRVDGGPVGPGGGVPGRTFTDQSLVEAVAEEISRVRTA